MNPWRKQYRLIGRENRDQKKEIESLKARLNSVATEKLTFMRNVPGCSSESVADNVQTQHSRKNIRLAQMDFQNDSEMLPPPLIPINTIEHQTPSFADQNVSSQPKPTSLSKARKAGTKSRTKSNAQSKMSRVLQKPSPWKCTICSGYFLTIDYLREHVSQYHPKRTWFCIRCPHSSQSESHTVAHEQDRDACEVKLTDKITLWVYHVVRNAFPPISFCKVRIKKRF